MVANMYYEFEDSVLMDLVDAEVSRHAAFLRYPDGGSAYDGLKIHTNDKPTIANFVSDAFRSVQSHFDGESSYIKKDGIHQLDFFLPDVDEQFSAQAESEVERYVVLSCTARWLMTRSFGEYAKMVATDAESSINRVIVYLRSRKFPI